MDRRIYRYLEKQYSLNMQIQYNINKRNFCILKFFHNKIFEKNVGEKKIHKECRQLHV